MSKNKQKKRKSIKKKQMISTANCIPVFHLTYLQVAGRTAHSAYKNGTLHSLYFTGTGTQSTNDVSSSSGNYVVLLNT